MARARELPIAHVLDRGVAGLALGMAIGRIGDVINGEHHATACAGVPWCVRYTSPSTLGQRDFVHPAVAYELVADLLILLALLALLRRDPPPLVPMLAFVGLYGLVRLALSPFRLDPAWLGAITEAQALATVRFLIELGADGRGATTNGENALFGPAYRGWNTLLGQLVDLGVDVNAVSKAGVTPWLAAAGFGLGRSIGFDEYHHGAHPSAELMALLERTWFGRAMLLAGASVFIFLWWSGRRFGPPLPADPRPPRSSLEYVRGFAGLLRRSGRSEIARERLRRDLRLGLAARYGLDPATPLDRILATAEADDPLLAAEARATDAALAGRLRDNELLRTVARVEGLVAKKERP